MNLNKQIRDIFTFHYVSIKSSQYRHLPSTGIIFTFHYVSIKSALKYSANDFIKYLHSTMYLLNLRGHGRLF